MGGLIQRLRLGARRRWAMTGEERFNRWLRSQGCRVGRGVRWGGLPDIHVDLTRPSLVEIGDGARITRGCCILTHGADWQVLRDVYHEVYGSSGPVRVGRNTFLGIETLLLKGASVGDNYIIGARSIVTGAIPANTVAVGSPARVVCTLEEYRNKRRALYAEEAKAYALSIWRNLGRRPVPADFWEEFPLFLKPGEDLPGAPQSLKKQLGPAWDQYQAAHIPAYGSFEAFLADAGVPAAGEAGR